MIFPMISAIGFYLFGRMSLQNKNTKEQEELIHKLYDGIEESIALITPDKKVLRFNQKYAALFGEWGGTYETFIEQLDIEDEITNHEMVFEHDGDNVFFLVTIKLFRHESIGDNVYLLSIRDITDRKKIEVKFQANSQLVSLGEMAGSIAHEINNPLAIINLSIASLKKHIAKDEIDKEKCNSMIDDVQETVKRISAIIKGLRNVSRDASEDEHSSATLHEIFEDVFSLCRKKFSNANVELKQEYGVTLEQCSLTCNASQLSQAFLNVLGNAFDAVRTLEEDNRWVRVKISEDAEKLNIKIENGGPKIPAEIRPRIFQPLFTTKDINNGTGLGLSVSRSTFEEHGGKLYLDEEYPTTCFVMTLPKS